MTRHVLITGGAGFIGSHIADAFVDRGWGVSVIDDLSTGDAANLNSAATFIRLDLREPRAAGMVRELAPDVICHHAAQADVRRSVADPVFDAEANIVATLRLLQAGLEAGVKKVVFASTGGAIYGEPIGGPQDESHPQQPLSPYGCAKLSIEHYLHFYTVQYGLPYVALRYANVYGPRQNAKGEAGVIAIFSRALLAGESPTINGSGEQTRDYVFIEDVVRANIAAAEGELRGAFNVGTGIETDVNQLYLGIARAAGSPRQARRGPAKPGEQMRSVLDGTKLRAIAALPDPVMLAEGLPRTVAWFRDNPR